MFKPGDKVKRKQQYINELWWITKCEENRISTDSTFIVERCVSCISFTTMHIFGEPYKFELVKSKGFNLGDDEYV